MNVGVPNSKLCHLTLMQCILQSLLNTFQAYDKSGQIVRYGLAWLQSHLLSTKLMQKSVIKVPKSFCKCIVTRIYTLLIVAVLWIHTKRKALLLGGRVDLQIKSISWKLEIEWNTQCRILPQILPLLKLCERSELVNISPLFRSFSQTRTLPGDLSQAKSKLDWKTSKMTRQFRREKYFW